MVQKPRLRDSMKNGAGYVETYPEVPIAILEVLIERGEEGANVLSIAGDANLLNADCALIACMDLHKAGFLGLQEDKNGEHRNKFYIREDTLKLLAALMKGKKA